MAPGFRLLHAAAGPVGWSLNPLDPKRKSVRIQIMRRVLFAVALGVLGLAQTTAAQSLGDIARKEGERRKTVKPSGKVYTNDSLRPEPPPSPGSVPVSTSTSSSGQAETPASPSTPAPGGGASSEPGGAKDEAYWQNRLKDAREQLQRAEVFAAALQSQINALTTDFVNRDDPVQRAAIGAKRDKAVAELERMNKEVAQHTQRISDIQEEGRRAGAPAGWLR
jgi:hypothetical protein